MSVWRDRGRPIHPGPAAAAGERKKRAPLVWPPSRTRLLCTAPQEGRVREFEQRGQRYTCSIARIPAKINPFFNDFHNISTKISGSPEIRISGSARPPPRSAQKAGGLPGLARANTRPARRDIDQNNERLAAPGSADPARYPRRAAPPVQGAFFNSYARSMTSSRGGGGPVRPRGVSDERGLVARGTGPQPPGHARSEPP